MEQVPLSLLNDFLFCNRPAGLKIVEGLRRANVHTVVGDLAPAIETGIPTRQPQARRSRQMEVRHPS